jgi:streptomycin 6-kinase
VAPVGAPLRVPDLVRQRATSIGAAGRRWLDELPEIVQALADRWDVDVESAFDGGTASLVVAATHASGRPCVVKIAMPPIFDDDNGDFARSVLSHQLADGVGCVALFDHDDATRAMLLERLGPNLATLAMPVPEILDTVAATLRAFWRPVGVDCALPTGGQQAAWLASFVVTTWDALGRPCSRDVVDRALAFCDERAAAFEPSAAVLVHGDAHGWNTLRAGEGSYKFVDPEGLRSERAHDLGILMREYNEPLLAGDTPRLAHERAELLAWMCDVDAEAVWQWGFIERVSTGLAGLRDFDGDDSMAFLEVATRCL